MPASIAVRVLIGARMALVRELLDDVEAHRDDEDGNAGRRQHAADYRSTHYLP